MSGRFDPPHERVNLSRDELRSLAALEQAFAEPQRITGVSPGFRLHLLAICLAGARLGPALVPVGVVLMLATLSSSVFLSATGAAITALGSTLWLRAPWTRVRARWSAITRRG